MLMIHNVAKGFIRLDVTRRFMAPSLDLAIIEDLIKRLISKLYGEAYC